MARHLRAAALVVALWATACGAQADRTAPAAGPQPAGGTAAPAASMARGPAAAPVTIFEFSDYQ